MNCILRWIGASRDRRKRAYSNACLAFWLRSIMCVFSRSLRFRWMCLGRGFTRSNKLSKRRSIRSSFADTSMCSPLRVSCPWNQALFSMYVRRCIKSEVGLDYERRIVRWIAAGLFCFVEARFSSPLRLSNRCVVWGVFYGLDSTRALESCRKVWNFAYVRSSASWKLILWVELPHHAAESMSYVIVLLFCRGRENFEVSASRSTTIDLLPRIFVFHLKRFLVDSYTGVPSKITRHVQFGEQFSVPKKHIFASVFNGGHSTKYTVRFCRCCFLSMCSVTSLAWPLCILKKYNISYT